MLAFLANPLIWGVVACDCAGWLAALAKYECIRPQTSILSSKTFGPLVALMEQLIHTFFSFTHMESLVHGDLKAEQLN